MLHAWLAATVPARRRRVLALLGAALALPACARVSPGRGDPTTAVAARPALRAAQSVAELERYRAADGQPLAYLAYRDPDIPTDTALALLPDRGSHAGLLALVGARLGAAGYHAYGLDRRGSGLNEASRGPVSAEGLLSDLDRFVEEIRPHYGRVVLAGFGWGGKLALAYDLGHPGRLGGLVLVAPELGPEPAPPAWAGSEELPTVGMAPQPRLARGVPRPRGGKGPLTAVGRELDQQIARAAHSRATPTLLLLAGQGRPGADDGAESLLRRGTPGTLSVAELPAQAQALPLEAPGTLAALMRAWLESFEEARLTRPAPRGVVQPS